MEKPKLAVEYYTQDEMVTDVLLYMKLFCTSPAHKQICINPVHTRGWGDHGYHGRYNLMDIWILSWLSL